VEPAAYTGDSGTGNVSEVLDSGAGALPSRVEGTALNEERAPDGQSEADAARHATSAAHGATESGTHPAFPVLDDASRSRVPGVCPFLRAGGDALGAPATTPTDGQVCIAIGSPRAQSTSQQELVCLRTSHVECPRYQRGALVPPTSRSRSMPVVPRATLAALLILVLSAGISFGYIVQRGGLDMPVVGPSETESAEAAVASPSAEAPSGGPGTAAMPSANASPEPSAAPTSAPTPTPEATPSPTPEPTAAPTPKPTAKPTPRSDRYKLLVKCPDRAGCWIYTVRSGDNLFSIANYFGHSLKTIYTWNPQYPGTRLKAGAEIRMPPPTR
jgi:hypothetical protein